MRKVRITPACWWFFGSRSKFGHGYVTAKGKTLYTHRVVWEHHYGAIPAGLVVRHLCGNPACVRPEHLALGTHADNVADTVEAGHMWYQTPERRERWMRTRGYQ